MHKIKHSKPYVNEADVKAVEEVINSRNHVAGKKTKEFEDKFCELIGTDYAKATSSGTTALHLALLALDIKKSDEVIIPSYVCQAVLNSINHTQATPVLADIDSDFEKGYNISAKTIKPLITSKTKAIIVPHMFGIPADIGSILKLEIPIIEDCSQTLGALYKEKTTGSIGDIGIFSFYATKIISTGQGGMIATSSEKLKQKIQDLTTYDKRKEYEVAYNYNMSDIQAALGLSQLNKLDFFITKRKEIANRYDEAFKDLGFKISNYKNSIPFRYVIQLENKEKRDFLEEKLKKQNIGVDKPVFKPLHRYLDLPSANFPNTELAYQTTLSIPIYPALTDEEVVYVIEMVRSFTTN